jgi:hypothetical protein
MNFRINGKPVSSCPYEKTIHHLTGCCFPINIESEICEFGTSTETPKCPLRKGPITVSMDGYEQVGQNIADRLALLADTIGICEQLFNEYASEENMQKYAKEYIKRYKELNK